MLSEEEIISLKNRLDSNGKLIITDDLPDNKKQRYEWINSLNVDLVELLSRKSEEIQVSDDSDSDDFDDSDVELLDEDTTSGSDIVEDNSFSADDLDNFF